MWVCAAGVMLGCAASKWCFGCVCLRVYVGGALCMCARCAVKGPEPRLEVLVSAVCAAVSAAGVAAARWKALGNAVARVPVRARACE